MKKFLASLLGLLMIALPLLGVLAKEASAASSRVAVIHELKGSVKVKKSGGSKEFTAFAKMSLNEGDVLDVGEGGYAVLQFANGTSEDDQMTVNANTTLTFSKLTDGKGTTTKVSMLNGSVWSTVKSIKNKDDQFTLETPTAIMGVRGTNLFVSVDPITGDARFAILSGIGQVIPTNDRTVPVPPDVFVYPGYQVTIDDRDPTNQFPDEVIPIFLDTLLSQASPKLLESIIKAKGQIDQENERFIEEQKRLMQLGQNNPAAGLNDRSDLDRIRNNLNHLIENLLNEALNNNLIQPNDLQKMIDEANRTLNKKIDLKNVPPIELTDAEKKKQEQLKQLELERLAKLQKQKEADLKRQTEELVKKLEDERKKLEEANKKAAEEAKKKAMEEYEKKLSEQEKKRFEEESKKREEELKNQTAAPSPRPSTGGGGGGGSGGSGGSPTPSPSPSPNPDPVLPAGISAWKMTTPNNQQLNLSRTHQSEHGNIYAARSNETVASVSLRIDFGSDVSRVTLNYMDRNENSRVIEWTASGESQTLDGLMEGYQEFVLSITKTDSGSAGSEIYLLNGEPEPDWAGMGEPFDIMKQNEYWAEYVKVGNQFRAEVSPTTEWIFVHPREYNILKILVNGVELTNDSHQVDLPMGETAIQITLTDRSYFFQHTFTLIVNRSSIPVGSMPEGINSWRIQVGEQTSNITASGIDAAYAILPSVLETEEVMLEIQLSDGYMGYVRPDEGQEGSPADLVPGVNTIPLDTHGYGYYRYTLRIYNAGEILIGETTLTIRVGNPVPENYSLDSGGITFRDDGSNLDSRLNYAGAKDYVVLLPAGTNYGWIDPNVFLDNFNNVSFLSIEDTQILWNNSVSEPVGGYYNISGLQEGTNIMTLKIDPLRQFGPNVQEYKLHLYVGEIPQSLRIASLTATDGAFPPNSIVFANPSPPKFAGEFFPGASSSQIVTFQLQLNPGTILDGEWLNTLRGAGYISLVQVPDTTSTFSIKYEYSGNFSLDLPLVLVDSSGKRMRYEISIFNNTGL